MSKLLIATTSLFLAVLCTARAQETADAPATSAEPSATTSKAATAPTAAKTPVKGATRADRLDLETTVVTGNRELPRVLYIVPWKKADLGELPAQPFNTLLDEVLQPVDRDVFKREVKYYQAVTNSVGSGAAQAKSGSTPPSTSPATPSPASPK